MNPSTYGNVTNAEAFGKGDMQCATLDEQRRTRIAIERVAEAAESIARSLNRAWYAEHPVGGKPAKPAHHHPVAPWEKPAHDVGVNFALEHVEAVAGLTPENQRRELRSIVRRAFDAKNQASGVLSVLLPLVSDIPALNCPVGGGDQ